MRIIYMYKLCYKHYWILHTLTIYKNISLTHVYEKLKGYLQWFFEPTQQWSELTRYRSVRLNAKRGLHFHLRLRLQKKWQKVKFVRQNSLCISHIRLINISNMIWEKKCMDGQINWHITITLSLLIMTYIAWELVSPAFSMFDVWHY
jgi:hypothetical protein